MTTTSQSTAFMLSQEEIFFLLSQIKAPGMLGIDPSPLAIFDGNQRLAVMGAARRALQARGLLHVGAEGELLLDPALRTTIDTASFAPRSLSMLHRKAGEEQLQSYIVHHAEPRWVEHHQPATGLHQLTLMNEPPAIQNQLEQLLGLAQQSAPPATGFRIDQAELERMQAAMADDPATLSTAIAAAGADLPSAGLFAELLTTPRVSTIFQTIIRPGEGQEEQTRTITVLQNQHGFWLIQSLPSNEVHCLPATADEVRQALASLVALL